MTTPKDEYIQKARILLFYENEDGTYPKATEVVAQLLEQVNQLHKEQEALRNTLLSQMCELVEGLRRTDEDFEYKYNQALKKGVFLKIQKDMSGIM